jgi:hypothetical protein
MDIIISTSNVGVARQLTPEGTRIYDLADCQPKRIKSPYSTDTDGCTDKLLWLFRDPANSQAEYAVWTNTSYGDSRASLTAFLDMIMPNIAKGMTISVKDLIGKQYKMRIVHKTSTTGKQYATHLWIEAVDTSQAISASPQQSPDSLPASPQGHTDPLTW